MDRAELLLDLLDQYLDVMDLWEIHHTNVANRELKGVAEREAHLRIQSEHMLPLMEKCNRVGIPYSTLMDIIPGAFKTTSAEREAIYEELVSYVEGLR